MEGPLSVYDCRSLRPTARRYSTPKKAALPAPLCSRPLPDTRGPRPCTVKCSSRLACKQSGTHGETARTQLSTSDTHIVSPMCADIRTAVVHYAHNRATIASRTCDDFLTHVRRLSHSRATTSSRPCDDRITTVSRLVHPGRLLARRMAAARCAAAVAPHRV